MTLIVSLAAGGIYLILLHQRMGRNVHPVKGIPAPGAGYQPKSWDILTPEEIAEAKAKTTLSSEPAQQAVPQETASATQVEEEPPVVLVGAK